MMVSGSSVRQVPRFLLGGFGGIRGAVLEAEAVVSGFENVAGRCQSNGEPPTRSATSLLASNDLPRKGPPLRQCGRASLLVDLPGDEMPLLIEMVVDLGVN